MPSSASKTMIVSRCTIKPDQTSTIKYLKLSVSDLPMLSCQYIQKGVLLTRPDNIPFDSLIPLLKLSLSKTLSHFPALAGRMKTDSSGFVHIDCNDLGVDFVEANATHLSIPDILPPPNNHHSSNNDLPQVIREFFTYDGVVSYEGHFKPLAAVQVTELSDGVFVGCAVNHAVTDGTSFWNFFNTFAEITKGVKKITKQPDFTRNYVKDSKAVLQFPDGNPKVTFDVDAPLRERIFHFSRESILKLKSRANNFKKFENGYEIMGKLSNDQNQNPNGKTEVNPTVEISSFQSLSAQLWRSVTRARKLPANKPTTFRMAVNCRHRLEPRIDPYYFGNAIQSIPTIVPIGELLSRDLCWSAEMLNKNVRAHNHDTVVHGVEEWEKNPRCFPLGNFDGASITMGSSPRFPMYDNDFGWGRPLAVRSGKANKFDGKISAFPGRDGGGSVDLEVCLSPDTMSGLENDTEFMQYVTDLL